MSVKVSSWVWHGDETAELAGNEMILLLALADVADDGGRCRFMQDEQDLAYASLAKKARVSVRTVATLVGKLREVGLLEHTRGTKRHANEFRIVVPWTKDADSASNGRGGSMQPPADSMQPATRFDATAGDRSSLIRVDVTTTSSPSDVASDDGVEMVSAEAVRLCNLLAELVRSNGHKVGVVGKQWWLAADRLMRLDEYTAEQVETIIRWATADEFWSANIRSMPKLREKFSTLRARRNAEIERRRPSVVEHGRTVDQMLADREAGQQLAVTS